MFFVFGIGKGGAVACFYGRFDWVWFDLLFFYSSSSSSSLEGGAKSLDAPALSASHRVRSAAAPLRATAALSPPPSFNKRALPLFEIGKGPIWPYSGLKPPAFFQRHAAPHTGLCSGQCPRWHSRLQYHTSNSPSRQRAHLYSRRVRRAGLAHRAHERKCTPTT